MFKPVHSRLLGTLLLGSVLTAAQAQPQAESAQRLKALVIQKALLFVDWPPASLAAGQPLQLCLLENTALAQELLALDGYSLNNHPLQVRPLRDRSLAGCHAALVGAGQDWSQAPPATLLIAEAPGMLQRGAMLNLLVEDGRVVFDIELDAARRAGLAISTKLLRLARFVRRS